MLPEPDLRKPYPLNWEEQSKLFQELPAHLEKKALFAVNTGCREQEVCRLRWEWEITILELAGIVAFIIPSALVKNGEDRLVVCNDIARSVIESQRGKHAVYVFTYLGKSIQKINTAAWRKARKRAGLSHVRVHDLKHAFGHRLRSAGVGFEDRQDLLGHRSGRITTHYSSAEVQNLYEATNKVTEYKGRGISLTVLRHLNRSQAAVECSSNMVASKEAL